MRSNSLVGTPGTLAAADGVRLVQAYLTTDPNATPITAPGARFA